MIIKLKIDVSKLDKNRLHKGAKGTYANLTVLLRDKTDRYGNDGMIVEDVSKEERESEKKGTIVGNVRIVQQKAANSGNQRPEHKHHSEVQVPQDDDMDSIPF